MDVIEHIVSVFEHIASVAESVLKSVRIILFFAGLALIYIASQFYSSESSWWWNIIKCGIPAIPVIVWGIVYSLLNQVKEVPETAREVVIDEDGLLKNLSELDIQQVSSIRGAYSTLKSFRHQEGLEEVMETISGVGILINPFFFVLALLTFFGLFGLIFIALLMLVF
ncbi:MAG: hypothetical protein MK188_00630 [Gammaproteobacteria bacterium]|nr:hypothetical protein [Gammaproteobacteria bacterium]